MLLYRLVKNNAANDIFDIFNTRAFSAPEKGHVCPKDCNAVWDFPFQLHHKRMLKERSEKLGDEVQRVWIAHIHQGIPRELAKLRP